MDLQAIAIQHWRNWQAVKFGICVYRMLITFIINRLMKITLTIEQSYTDKR